MERGTASVQGACAHSLVHQDYISVFKKWGATVFNEYEIKRLDFARKNGCAHPSTDLDLELHGDIVGSFRTSHHGQFKWALILVDDHTRFKMAYAMRSKSDAPMYVRRFLAAFKALGSIGKSQAMSIVGALHTDNAGEFLSHEFSEPMDDELIHHTTCPPHVHQLNGVAERAPSAPSWKCCEPTSSLATLPPVSSRTPYSTPSIY